MIIQVFERNINETLENRHKKFRLISKGEIETDNYDPNIILKEIRKKDFISNNIILINTETGECDLEMALNVKHFNSRHEVEKWLKPRCREMLLIDNDINKSYKSILNKRRSYR